MVGREAGSLVGVQVDVVAPNLACGIRNTNIRGSLYDDAGSVVSVSNSLLIDELPAKALV